MKKMLFVPICFILMNRLEAQSNEGARRLLYYERYDSAARMLQYLTQADPNNAEAWWLMTRACLHKGQVKEIRDKLLSLPAGNINAPFVSCAYGQVMLRDNKKDSAGIYFNKALTETKQKDPAILLAIAEAEVEEPNGDPSYALDLIGMALKKDKHNPRLYVASGNAYRRLQNGTESYKAYQDAISQDAKYVEASYKLGKIFITQENPDMYLKYFTDAVMADSLYAPAWYELYYYYYFRDVNKAMDCLQHYISATDKCPRNEYLLTDLLYASKKYREAIDHARLLIGPQGNTPEPRMYKLIAYSYKELNDTIHALQYMRNYFSNQNDTGFVTKDYETMGDIFERLSDRKDSAAFFYVKAEASEKDSTKKRAYYKKLADIYKQLKNYPDQAIWLGRYYEGNPRASNLDLFNWGLADYMAKDYKMADSVFGMYENKYPEQNFGYYWRARSNAAIDTAMQGGLAIPHYLKFIELTAKDTANALNRRHLIESYGYIAAYKANTEKNYQEAVSYFEKLLTLDPANSDARKYVDILKKNMEKSAGKNETSKTTKQG